MQGGKCEDRKEPNDGSASGGALQDKQDGRGDCSKNKIPNFTELWRAIRGKMQGEK